MRINKKTIEEIQDEIFRKMSPGKKIRIAGSFFEFARKYSPYYNVFDYDDRPRKASYQNR